jgi:hypothetical protein
MKKLPMQMIMVTMEDGRRGVFVGSPMIKMEVEDECRIDTVEFSHVNELPKEATLAEIISLTDLQAELQTRTIQ